MAHPELLIEINKQIAEKRSAPDIKKSLLAKGWQEGDINGAFALSALSSKPSVAAAGTTFRPLSTAAWRPSASGSIFTLLLIFLFLCAIGGEGLYWYESKTTLSESNSQLQQIIASGFKTDVFNPIALLTNQIASGTSTPKSASTSTPSLPVLSIFGKEGTPPPVVRSVPVLLPAPGTPAPGLKP